MELIESRVYTREQDVYKRQVLTLPHMFAAMTVPDSAAIMRTPATANSRNMMMASTTGEQTPSTLSLIHI